MRRIKYDVFLSGPISGVADFRERFERAERWSRKKYGENVRVWNPATLPAGKSYRWYMARSMIALFRSGSMLKLHGWEKSPGARAEVAVAECIHVKVLN